MDFIEACDRILFEDEWFPTIARIRDVAALCTSGRLRREEAQASTSTTTVCRFCLGARWVRLGGFDPMNMHAGETGSRVAVCPHCTRDGRYDRHVEQEGIRRHGGVPVPDTEHRTSVPAGVTWPAQMDAMRNPLTGKIDMELLYRKSRELRGLDPDVDERPKNVAGWKSAGSVAARELVQR